MQYVHTLQLACFARTSHPLCLLDADAKWSYCRYLRYRLPSHVDLRCDPTSRVNCWYVVSLSPSISFSPRRESQDFSCDKSESSYCPFRHTTEPAASAAAAGAQTHVKFVWWDTHLHTVHRRTNHKAIMMLIITLSFGHLSTPQASGTYRT